VPAEAEHPTTDQQVARLWSEVIRLQGIFRDSPGLAGSLFWLAIIWAIFLALGAWIVERREYVLEQ
jgi:hypothetical protein